MPAKWVHPTEDPLCIQDQVQFQDPRDPRTQGEGPCGTRHDRPITVEESKEDRVYFHFHGNRFGRWVDCRKCYLRLMYWPKLGAAGNYQAAPAPIVTLALESLKEQGHWEICDMDLMREHFKRAAALQKMEGAITRDHLLEERELEQEREKQAKDELTRAARQAAREVAESLRRPPGGSGLSSAAPTGGKKETDVKGAPKVDKTVIDESASRPKLKVKRNFPAAGASGSQWPPALPTPPSRNSSPELVPANEVTVLEDDFDQEDTEVNMTTKELQDQIKELQRKNKLLVRKVAEAEEETLPIPPPPPPLVTGSETPGQP